MNTDHLIYPGSCGMLRWVRECGGNIYCSSVCLEAECGVSPEHEDAHGVFVEELPPDGVVCCVCGERHGAGMNTDPPPDELAVLDWVKIRMAELHANFGIAALSLMVARYDHSGEIEATWTLHRDGKCVINNRTIVEGVGALNQPEGARP